MRVILDTNVFVSGVFFTGPPYQILKAWREGRVKLIVSPEILEEYERVGKILAEEFPSIFSQSSILLQSSRRLFQLNGYLSVSATILTMINFLPARFQRTVKSLSVETGIC